MKATKTNSLLKNSKPENLTQRHKDAKKTIVAAGVPVRLCQIRNKLYRTWQCTRLAILLNFAPLRLCVKIFVTLLGVFQQAAKYWLLPLSLAITISGCNKQPETVTPHELTAGDSCSLDGMSLLDFPGPKAQIHYANGEKELFCDTTEMFSIYLQPEQQKRVTGIFTQDMAKTSWEEPRNNWVDAKQMFFVLGSKRHGAMGPTLASFAQQKDADAFARQFGGKVYRFNDITMDLVDLSGGVVHDEQM